MLVNFDELTRTLWPMERLSLSITQAINTKDVYRKRSNTVLFPPKKRFIINNSSRGCLSLKRANRPKVQHTPQSRPPAHTTYMVSICNGSVYGLWSDLGVSDPLVITAANNNTKSRKVPYICKKPNYLLEPKNLRMHRISS